MNAVDTNILVYAFDTDYPQKQAICRKIVQDIFDGKDKGVVTNQILAEFASAVTKKIDKPLEWSRAQAIIGTILASSNWEVLNYSGETILKALESKIPFWDSLIVQTLKENNVTTIITENTKDFVESGIKAINPFH